MTNGDAKITVNVREMEATKDFIQRAANEAYQKGLREGLGQKSHSRLQDVRSTGVHAQTSGADVQLVEFCSDPDDVKIVIPNAIIINGQRTYLSADTPVTIEYEPNDNDGMAIPVVTVRLQCRRLLIEARSEKDITNAGSNAAEERKQYLRDHALLSTREVGTLSSDGNQVSVPDQYGLHRWEPVKPCDPEAKPETPEERWKRQDREYFDLVGKKVRIVDPARPVGRIGEVMEYWPETGPYRARFEIQFAVGHRRTYIRDAFEVVADV